MLFRSQEAVPTATPHAGAILNPVWVDTAQVGTGHVSGAHMHNLEQFRVTRGAILNPLWIDSPRVGLGYDASGTRARLEPFRSTHAPWPRTLSRWSQATNAPYIPPPSPGRVHATGANDVDWAVALSTYDFLQLEEMKHSVHQLMSWGSH